MKLCIDWEAIHQDWQASGLSKNRYFLSGGLRCDLETVIAYLPFYSVSSGKSGLFSVFHGSSVLRSDCVRRAATLNRR